MNTKPGRELDLLIAEKVMGCKTRIVDGWNGEPVSRMAVFMSLEEITVPAYSTDIAAAWLVVEEMKAEKYKIQITVLPKQKTGVDMTRGNSSLFSYWAEGDSAPHAICLAALKARGVEI